MRIARESRVILAWPWVFLLLQRAKCVTQITNQVKSQATA